MSRWYGDCIYGQELYKGIPQTPEGLVSLFAWEPNWNTGVSMKYRYNTVISTTRLLQEQRKPLLAKPLRTETFSVLDDDPVFSSKLEGYFKKYHAKQILIPLYTEPVMIDTTRSATTLNGLTALPVINRIADCYNFLNWAKLAVIIDIKGTLTAELISLSDISATAGNWTVTASGSVATAYPANRCVMYPILEAVLDTKTITDHTDTVTEFEFTFKEVFLYGV